MTSKKTHSHSRKAKVALGHPLVSAAFWEDASRMGCWAASQKTRAMPPASEPGGLAPPSLGAERGSLATAPAAAPRCNVEEKDQNDLLLVRRAREQRPLLAASYGEPLPYPPSRGCLPPAALASRCLRWNLGGGETSSPRCSQAGKMGIGASGVSGAPRVS